ncbi:MAG: TetR/AcrR family transcriptional regulator [Myxococcales bacterium]|nr:TetR/AcrR family transcriptional regulator [Myxococcales bacterium]
MPRISADTIAAHREETWARLQVSFLEVLQERGFAALSLAEVARRAGVARNTIYNYATDKHGLLVAVVGASVEAFVTELLTDGAAGGDPRERLAALVRKVVPYFERDGGLPLLNAPDEVLQPEVAAALAAAVEPIMAMLEELLAEGSRLGLFRALPERRLVVDLIVGVMTSARRAVLTGQDSEVVAAETLAFLLAALT